MEEILDGILMLWDWLMSNLIVINLVLSVIIVFECRRRLPHPGMRPEACR